MATKKAFLVATGRARADESFTGQALAPACRAMCRLARRSSATVVVLMLWLLLSAAMIVVGAEVNAEAERQTAEDTTKGPERPLGTRDAYAADTVAG